MSKPLELTIYPLLEKVGRHAEPGYIVGKRGVTVPDAWYLESRKRLKDLELVAEYHASNAASWGARAFSKTRNGSGRGYEELAVSEDNRMDTFHRFAATPHYSEA